jgi:hypothetical protein
MHYLTEKELGSLRRFLARLLPTVGTIDLVMGIVDFRLAYADSTALIHERTMSGKLAKEGPVWTDIESERAQFPSYDVESLEKIVDFVDRQRGLFQTLVYTVAAGVVGAIVGAVATWVV